MIKTAKCISDANLWKCIIPRPNTSVRELIERGVNKNGVNLLSDRLLSDIRYSNTSCSCMITMMG